MSGSADQRIGCAAARTDSAKGQNTTPDEQSESAAEQNSSKNDRSQSKHEQSGSANHRDGSVQNWKDRWTISATD